VLAEGVYLHHCYFLPFLEDPYESMLTGSVYLHHNHPSLFVDSMAVMLGSQIVCICDTIIFPAVLMTYV
jgi:hypothetical protein